MLHSGSDVTRVEGGEEDPGRCVKAVMKEERQVRHRQEVQSPKQTAEGRDRKGDSERGRNPNLSNGTCEFWVIGK